MTKDWEHAPELFGVELDVVDIIEDDKVPLCKLGEVTDELVVDEEHKEVAVVLMFAIVLFGSKTFDFVQLSGECFFGSKFDCMASGNAAYHEGIIGMLSVKFLI